jgi:hypothetical protein
MSKEKLTAEEEEDKLPPYIYKLDAKYKTKYKCVNVIYRGGKRRDMVSTFDSRWEALCCQQIIQKLEELWDN